MYFGFYIFEGIFMSFSNKTSLSDFFKHFFFQLLVGFVFCFIIFLLSRVIFLLTFASDFYSTLPSSSKFLFWSRSLRFDVKYIAFSFVPVFVFGYFLAYTKITRVWYSVLSSVLVPVAIVFCLLFSVINFYYYKTYEKVIDTFFFAVFKEDPVALVKTLYEEYHLVYVILILIVAVTLIVKLNSYIVSSLVKRFSFFKSKKLVVFLCILPCLYFLALRGGSVSTFPIRQEHSQISQYPVINSAILNGVSALYYAHKWYKEQAVIPDISEQDIIQTVESLGYDRTGSDIYTPLKKKIKQHSYASNNKPDIVLSVMESMSTHMITMLENKTDIYGDLKKHIEDKNDFYFKNFLSEGNGTMDSLTRILFSIPDLNLSTSEWSDKKYKTSFIDLFHSLGYKIIFVISSTGAWRDIFNFLIKQGIDGVYDSNSIREKYPDVTEGDWGIDDEFLFDFSYDLLKEKHSSPLFVITLSITNHPPFRVPGSWEPKSIPIEESLRKRILSDADPSVMFATLRYANDQLGRFITRVKEDSELKDKTFLAFTGDHNIRSIGYKAFPDDILISYAVPFYIHIPEQYQQHEKLSYNPNRYGSHKDILTTIASRIYSDSQIITFGCDLLSDESCSFPWAYNARAGTLSSGGFLCNLEKSYTFTSAKIVEGLKVDSSKINIDEGKCEELKLWIKYQEQLYWYQASRK